MHNIPSPGPGVSGYGLPAAKLGFSGARGFPASRLTCGNGLGSRP